MHAPAARDGGFFDALPEIEGLALDPGRRITLADQGVWELSEVVESLDLSAARRLPEPLVTSALYVDHATAAARLHLQKREISYLTRDGELHLRAPGVYVLVEYRSKQRRMRPTVKGPFTAVELRVLFVLLTGGSDMSYRQLSSSAGASIGSVKRCVDKLRERKLFYTGTKAYLWADPAKLIDVWAEGYRSTLLPKLRQLRFRFSGSFPTDLPSGFLLSGPAASSRYYGGKLLPGDQVEAFSDELSNRSGQFFSAPPDPNGNLVIREKFWSHPISAPAGSSPILLVYADLVADGGLRELAEAERLLPAVLKRMSLLAAEVDKAASLEYNNELIVSALYDVKKS